MANTSSTNVRLRELVRLLARQTARESLEGTDKQGLGTATDDRRIERAVKRFGGDVMMTSKHHQSGTDRLAEVARKIRADWLVNIQGDLPFIHAELATQDAFDYYVGNVFGSDRRGVPKGMIEVVSWN